MGKYSPEGVFYLHLTIITFALLTFIILKNFNFEDFENSPDLTTTQVNFILLFLLTGVIGILLFLVRGFTIKTPDYYTRAGIALVLIVTGLVIITGMLFHDPLLGNERTIGSLEMMGILFGSFLSVVGSLVYISIKFPDTRMMKVFKQAVKEEIRKRASEENAWRAWQVKQARENRLKRKQGKQKQVRAKIKDKKPKKETPLPQTTVQTATMEPASELTIVNCAKCGRSLKVSSEERPVTIKCPYCEAIGVIKE
jgi:DNA-directed RNA polymerase subunit RPC12/RpoP